MICLQCAGLDLRFQATWFSKLQVELQVIKIFIQEVAITHGWFSDETCN